MLAPPPSVLIFKLSKFQAQQQKVRERNAPELLAEPACTMRGIAVDSCDRYMAHTTYWGASNLQGTSYMELHMPPKFWIHPEAQLARGSSTSSCQFNGIKATYLGWTQLDQWLNRRPLRRKICSTVAQICKEAVQILHLYNIISDSLTRGALHAQTSKLQRGAHLHEQNQSVLTIQSS